MKLRCGECASRNIKKTDLRGQRFLWKDYPSVLLTKDFSAAQCEDCGEIVFTGSDAKDFDEAIRRSIKQQVATFIDVILEREPGLTQTTLAERLGISPEYLSEIKSGRKQPAFGVFNFLKTLALDKKAFKESDPEFLSNTMIRKMKARA